VRAAGAGASLIGLAALAVAACTEAGLQAIPPPEPEPYDDLLRIDGRFCTEPPEQTLFPVKILFVLDQSASLHCTDSQNRRYGALQAVVNDLAPSPNVSFGFVGFSSWSRLQGFTRDRGLIDKFLDPAGGLGPATDYQGALATTLRVLEEDMLEVGPAERTRSRYVVVMVSDGVPEPRCNPGCEDDETACSDGIDNDGDGLPDGSDPDCANIEDSSLHPDNLYGVCNTSKTIPEGVYVDMEGQCPAYNQPELIQQRISAIRDLEAIYSAGAVTLNTVLLFSPQEVVEGICPGASAQFGYNQTIAQALLQQMALAGGGVFRDVNLEEADESFLAFEFASLESAQWMTEMGAVNLNARPAVAANGEEARDERPALDTDMDGLPDDLEVAQGTDKTRRDTDGDGYGDLVERRLSDAGFDPKDAARPAAPCADDADYDGDRLVNCEELALETALRDPDTDGDGLLDWLEVVAGTDPRADDARRDLDFDGVMNRDELRGATDPLASDALRYRDHRTRYRVTDLGDLEVPLAGTGDLETRHCYDFTVDHIRLTTPAVAADRGRNRILLYSLEQPVGLAGAETRGQVACVEVRYQGPSDKQPADGRVDLSDARWETLRRDIRARFDSLAACVGVEPEDLRRQRLVEVSQACLPPKVALGDILVARDALESQLARSVRTNLEPRMPEVGAHVFVPIEIFDPALDCVRLADLDQLVRYLDALAGACPTCAGARPPEPDPDAAGPPEPCVGDGCGGDAGTSDAAGCGDGCGDAAGEAGPTP
jgi:hypothetical protein